MTTIDLKNGIKTGLVGLIAAAGLGLIVLPAKADELNQGNTQTTGQEGYSNTSVQQNTQTGEIEETETRFGRPDRRERDRNSINQGNDQLTDQYGDGNTSVNQNTQEGRIRKDRFEVRDR
jgi:U3 small nucleolar ribonucleoprotein component